MHPLGTEGHIIRSALADDMKCDSFKYGDRTRSGQQIRRVFEIYDTRIYSRHLHKASCKRTH